MKIAAAKFLIRACEALIHNCDVFSQMEEESSRSVEELTVKSLLQMVAQRGLISQVHVMLSQKDTPLLFVTLAIKLLHKLVLMDHKRALPVLSQLDYWTFLVELLSPQSLRELERHENRLILQQLQRSLLRGEDPCRREDTVLLALNAILELVFEGFKRDSQLANLLVKTTKLMSNVFDALRALIDEDVQLQNKNLFVIYFDRVVKLLHLSMMHPRDYSVELIDKFLSTERRVPAGAPPSNQVVQRHWVYITEMFRLVSESPYGQTEVKLALSRFVAEFLIRSGGSDHYLDEMLEGFDGARYFEGVF